MSTDLTDADVPQWVRDFPGGIRIYRAGELNGLAAGRARAIEECAVLCQNIVLKTVGNSAATLDQCTAALAALNARSASADES